MYVRFNVKMSNIKIAYYTLVVYNSLLKNIHQRIIPPKELATFSFVTYGHKNKTKKLKSHINVTHEAYKPPWLSTLNSS